MKITHASSLTNTQLVAEVSRLAGGEREATVALLVHLAEFDARRLHEGAGFQSLFDYCMRVLHFSEDAATNRIAAARVARRYPVVLDMLIDGRLSPTTTRLLKRYLTPENHQELLAAASGKSKREVEELLAWRYPEPDVRSSVRALSTPATPVPASADPPAPSMGLLDRTDANVPPVPSPVRPSPPTRTLVRPLAPERYEIRFTASADSLEKLRLAQDMLSHSIPNGDLAQVFDRALTALLQDLARKRFAATKRPRQSRGQAEDSEHVPAAVQRVVWVRDHGRCRFVAPDGRRCDSRRFIQFHHVHPRGAGGKATPDNIQLRCGAHNRHEAELFYGPCKRHGGVDVVSERTALYGRITDAVTRRGTGGLVRGAALTVRSTSPHRAIASPRRPDHRV